MANKNWIGLFLDFAPYLGIALIMAALVYALGWIAAHETYIEPAGEGVVALWEGHYAVWPDHLGRLGFIKVEVGAWGFLQGAPLPFALDGLENHEAVLVKGRIMPELIKAWEADSER